MRTLLTGAVVFVVLWAASCNRMTTSPSTTTTSEGQKSQAASGVTAARTDKALVRFINADADGSMDVWMDGALAFSNVSYKMTTPYREIPAHVGEFQLRESGGTQDLAGNRREMFQGRHYTLMALPRGYRGSRLAVLSDDLGLLEPGEAAVRLVNATSNVDDLDLYLEGTNKRVGHGVDPGIANSVTIIKPTTLEIRQQNQPAFKKLTGIKVEADRLYTFVVLGVADALDVVRVEDRINR